MLKMRLQRTGRKNNPSFRVIVTDSRRGPKSGDYVDLLGSYDPKAGKPIIDGEKAKDWIGKGAQVSDTVHNMLVDQGIIDGKKINALPRKSPIVKESEEKAETPAEEEKKDGAAEEAPAETTDEPEAAPTEETPQEEPEKKEEEEKTEEAPVEEAPAEEAQKEEQKEETPAAEEESKEEPKEDKEDKPAEEKQEEKKE